MKYILYEAEKRRLQAQNIDPKEYEREIRKIAKKLKI